MYGQGMRKVKSFVFLDKIKGRELTATDLVISGDEFMGLQIKSLLVNADCRLYFGKTNHIIVVSLIEHILKTFLHLFVSDLLWSYDHDLKKHPLEE